MPDREKVTKELEWQINVFTSYCASDERLLEAMKAALALLKEQEKTPVVFSQDDGSVTTACGNCGWDLDKAYSRCPKCQKELDWNALQE